MSDQVKNCRFCGAVAAEIFDDTARGFCVPYITEECRACGRVWNDFEGREEKQEAAE